MADNTPLSSPTQPSSPLVPGVPSGNQSVANLQQQLQPAHQDPVNHPAFGAPADQQMQSLMAQIIDIERPPEVGLWPLAPGWWVLCALVIISSLVGTVALFKFIKRRSYRRSGLKLLKRLGNGSEFSHSGLARQLNELLKRTALASPYYRHLYIGSTHSKTWQQFLCMSSPEFPNKEQVVEGLTRALYRPKAQLDTQLAIAFCEFWIRQHRNLPEGAEATLEVSHV